MGALVGADFHPALDPAQNFVGPGRQRLFDQRDADTGASLDIGEEIFLAPGLVGVDDQRRARRAGAHGQQPLGVALARELDLQQRPMRGARRRRSHLLGRSDREGEGGGQGRERGEAGASMRRDAPGLGLQIPHGAIQRVARRARRKQALQRGAIRPGLDVDARALHLRHNAVGALAVTGVGHAFAPSDGAAGPQGRGHDQRLRLGAARDHEAPFDRKGLDGHGQLGAHLVS